MASTTRQPKLYRFISFSFFVALIFCVLSSGPPGRQALAEGIVESSGYSVFRGEQFFALTDSSYGTDTTAFVRIEAPSYLSEYSGVDIVVYRIANPFQFLKKQKNLHRIELRGYYDGEGLANALRYLWDSWNKKARYAWERLFSSSARKKMTEQAPVLKRHPKMNKPTEFENNPQYKPLPGYKVVERFRYPLWNAKPIEPPKDVKLEGSSSNFVSTSEGNVMVPIGRQKAGLYLVEAIIGSYRATTLVFVSDTIALTKNSSDQLMVWAANRQTGKAVNDVKVAWTDGVGTLQSGRTDNNGALIFRHNSPEHTYVVGQDNAGGVFISENFYYDSEIYNAKIYAFTDRPLYRPGDTVHIKFTGREFKDARRSVPLASGNVYIKVIDPNGTHLFSQNLKILPDSGADTKFILPKNSVSGGYDLRFEYSGNTYGGSFRVTEYVKPHFEINLVPGMSEFKTGEPITGKIVLAYPDGKPVKGATVQMTVHSQQLTMVENELQHRGQFPIKLETEELVADHKGTALFTLPPADRPSRYVLTLFANDSAAYRVKVTKEILIERGVNLYKLTAPQNFTSPGEAVVFSFLPMGAGGTTPTKWEIIRLESQKKTTGKIDGSSNQCVIRFGESGSYTVMLRDNKNNLMAATNHWVSGEGLKTVPGSIEIVFDKNKYLPGETAKVLITFPEPVQEALLTLERDRVEKYALMSQGGSWLRIKKISSAQWQAEIQVKEEFAPNMTFSVLYSLNGDYVFQNRGLQVAQESVSLHFKPDKQVYLPGEKVTVEVNSSLNGKPVPANITISVVDEMIYILQPEIAPDMFEFFYHPRRNNVRTSSSLSFISYDMASSPLADMPSRTNAEERSMKVLERPRRDNIDTAFWAPNLKTDHTGKAVFTFIMPDALTRWRITGRASTINGFVGQKTSSIQSSKPLYLTWSGPARFRQGDTPVISVVAFNQTQKLALADLSISGSGFNLTRKLELKPGPNYLSVPTDKIQKGLATFVLNQNGTTMDILKAAVEISPVKWVSPRSQIISVNKMNIPLKLPIDAENIRLTFAGSGAAHFNRIIDDLVEFPWGCVEQTASRLIPLSIAYQNIGGESKIAQRIAPVLQTNRLRLIHMAGPAAAFGWWGNMTANSPLWTAYAYYADWHAGKALHVVLPKEDWLHVLDIYSKYAEQEPLLHRALTIWFAGEMGLPIRTMLDGLQDQVKTIPSVKESKPSLGTSFLLVEPTQSTGQQIALVLIAHMATQQQQKLKPLVSNQLASAKISLRNNNAPVVQALLLMQNRKGKDKKTDPSQVDKILAMVQNEMPTFDRAVTLLWLQKALDGTPTGKHIDVKLRGSWDTSISQTGSTVWRFTGTKLTNLNLTTVPTQPVTAIIRYDSAVSEPSLLPVRIDRKLYLLKPAKKSLNFTAEPVKNGAHLNSGVLYVEEITLLPKENMIFRYGLLEVPLPPGADVERTTWGMRINNLGAKEPHSMEKVRHEMGQMSYSVPIDILDKPITVRHLIRFSQKGKFNLPPIRFFRMYQPEQKAFEGDGKNHKIVEVF